MIQPVAEFFNKNSPHHQYKNRFYAVFLFRNGCGSLSIDNQEFRICADRFFFINYHQIYHFREVSAEGFVCMFTKSFYNHVYTGNRLIRSDSILTNVPPYSDMEGSGGKDLWQRFRLLQREFSKNHPLSREILCLELKILILQYLRSAGTIEVPGRAVHHKKQLAEQFSELVDKHYKEFRTTAPYAKMLNITPNYLNALTKAYSGFTAGQLIKNRVILEAERLLMHTVASVSEISYELGFHDNSHFGTYFKSAKGISPQRYRTEKSRPDIF